MKRAPTDLAILNRIYERYYDEFSRFRNGTGNRETKIYVPIDVTDIANSLGVDPDIVFGRLYYHLDYKYGYERKDGTHVHLFALKAGRHTHCINFPYLGSVVASLREERRRYRLSTWIALGALVISAVSFGFSLG